MKKPHGVITSVIEEGPRRETGLMNLFSTHPPIEERIRRLEEMTS